MSAVYAWSSVSPRAASFWNGAHAPRHLPPALGEALHQVVEALHDHPGRRHHVTFQGVLLDGREVANLCHRCVAPIPRRTAMALADLDRVKGLRWLSEDRTVAEAARYIRAMITF